MLFVNVGPWEACIPHSFTPHVLRTTTVNLHWVSGLAAQQRFISSRSLWSVPISSFETKLCGLKLVSGECKQFMTQYLDCLKKNSSTSSDCRHLSRDYLNCRMQKYVIRVQLDAY